MVCLPTLLEESGLLQSGGSTLSEKQIGATSAQLLSQWNPPVEPHGQTSCTEIQNNIWSSKSQIQTLRVLRPGNGLLNYLGQEIPINRSKHRREEFILKFICARCAGGQYTFCPGIKSLHSPEVSTFLHILAAHVPEILGGWFSNLLNASRNDPRQCNYASVEGTKTLKKDVTDEALAAFRNMPWPRLSTKNLNLWGSLAVWSKIIQDSGVGTAQKALPRCSTSSRIQWPKFKRLICNG